MTQAELKKVHGDTDKSKYQIQTDTISLYYTWKNHNNHLISQ